jgi:hypothetical protein
VGNHIEANAELVKITAELRGHPDVLEVRLAIYALTRKWDVCVDIARPITKPAPYSPVYRIGGSWGTPCAPIRILRLWRRETIGVTGLSLTPNARPHN